MDLILSGVSSTVALCNLFMKYIAVIGSVDYIGMGHAAYSNNSGNCSISKSGLEIQPCISFFA